MKILHYLNQSIVNQSNAGFPSELIYEIPIKLNKNRLWPLQNICVTLAYEPLGWKADLFQRSLVCRYSRFLGLIILLLLSLSSLIASLPYLQSYRL